MPEGDYNMKKNEQISDLEKNKTKKKRKLVAKIIFFILIGVFLVIFDTAVLMRLTYETPDDTEMIEKLHTVSNEIIEKKTVNIDNPYENIKIVEIDRAFEGKMIIVKSEKTTIEIVFDENYNLISKEGNMDNKITYALSLFGSIVLSCIIVPVTLVVAYTFLKSIIKRVKSNKGKSGGNSKLSIKSTKKRRKVFSKKNVKIFIWIIIWVISTIIITEVRYVQPDSTEVVERVYAISDEIIKKKTLNVNNNDPNVLIEVEENDSNKVIKIEAESIRITLTIDHDFEVVNKQIWKANGYYDMLFWCSLITGWIIILIHLVAHTIKKLQGD